MNLHCFRLGLLALTALASVPAQAVSAVPPQALPFGFVPAEQSDGMARIPQEQWTTFQGTGRLAVCQDTVSLTGRCPQWLSASEFVKRRYPSAHWVGYQLLPRSADSTDLVLFLKQN